MLINSANFLLVEQYNIQIQQNVFQNINKLNEIQQKKFLFSYKKYYSAEHLQFVHVFFNKNNSFILKTYYSAELQFI